MKPTQKITKPLDKKNVQDIVALSPMQEGILFHYLNTPDSEQYFEQLGLNISGNIKPETVRAAWNTVIENNEMLRTIFRWEKIETPAQIVLKQHPLTMRTYDFSSFDDDRKKQLLLDIKEKDKEQRFDLRDVPFRVTLCKLSGDNETGNYEMIISNHHILYDGWSNGLLLKEFQQAYEDIFAGKSPQKIAKNRFKEFVKWNRIQDKTAQETFWKEYLKEFETKTQLPADMKKHTEIQQAGKYRYKFSPEWTLRMSDFARDQGITLATLLYSVWGILLKRYNNIEVVVFGTTVSGRSAKVKGIENMVGLFINTLPLRIKTTTDEQVDKLLANVDLALNERENFENTPLVDIKSYSQLNDKYDIFDSIMIIENYPLDKALSGNGKRLNVESFSMMEMTNYDLAVEVNVFDELGVNFIYNADLFYRDTIKRLSKHFVNILQAVVETPHIKIQDIRMLGPDERRQALYEFNQTEVDYPEEKTIQELFEAQVERTPEAVAVKFGDQPLTYARLNHKANALAARLKAKGCGPDQIVGLMLERSNDLMAAIMGILKAGGAYLPLVPDLPESKLTYMLEDSSAQLLVTQENLKDRLPFNGEIFILDQTEVTPGKDDPILPNPEPANGPGHLAYVIYTSGTTGNPKGVMVEHRNVVNFIKGMTDIIDFAPGRTVMGVTTISFDIFVLESLLALAQGLTIIMAPEEAQRNPELLSEIIFKNDIDILQTTPSRMQILLTEVSSLLSLKRLDTIMLGGEAFPETLLKELSWKTPARIYNVYGPTETTVWSTAKELTGAKKIDIGVPIANTQIYILDRNRTPQPIGVPGELCIGGDGVTRGYLERPDLTAEKFVPNPFIPGKRMYKTGDLAKWLPDGNIEFIGRVDFQVKIRGFRIELGEIETQLLSHRDIKEAVVLDLEDETKQKYLGAYIVARRELEPKAIREYLAERVAEYMVPSFIIQMDQFPLTTSGKINRKALPEPEKSAAAATEYEAPGNEIEEKMVKIWQDLFQLEQVGINDNFFDLGGHSLKAISLASRVAREFDVQLPVTVIFKNSNIKSLAKYIQDAEASIYLAIQPVREGEFFPLSAAQKRMYALHQMETDSTGYNMSGMMRVEGELDRVRFQETFGKLIRRHESFRTSFSLKDGDAVQQIHEFAPFHLEFFDASGSSVIPEPPADEEAKHTIRRPPWASEECQLWPVPEEARTYMDEFIRPFDLTNAPLIRIGLIRLDKDKHLLLVDMHHIISDGSSLAIIARDFVGLYEDQELPPLRVQYKGYARWQQEMAKKGIIHQQEEFWKSQFEGEIPVLDLATDFPRPAVQSFEGDAIDFKLSADATEGLKEIADSSRSSLYMVLLAIYNVLLSRYSGQEDVIVGSVISGRPHIDLEDIVGVFVNTIALRNYPKWDKPFEDFLDEVKNRSLESYENQDFQFEELVEKLNLKRDMSRNPLFDTMFSFEHIDIREMFVENLVLRTCDIDTLIAKFDLSLTAVERDGEILFNLEYCTRLFKRATVETMARHFINIVETILRTPEVAIGNIDMMSDDERRQLLFQYNDTHLPYPQEKFLQQLVEAQAQRTPDNIAICGPSVRKSNGSDNVVPETLTYRQLNQQANRLAHSLREKGAGPERVVAVMVDRSVEMMVSLLGILKAGAAYVPIDPVNPAQRINHILKDSDTKLLLTHRHIEAAKTFDGEWIYVEEEAAYASESTNPPCINTPGDPVYVIYTSGSTGNPKGVLVEHGNVVAYISAFLDEFHVTGDDVLMQQASFAFDAFVEEIYPILLSGGKIIIADKSTLRDIHLLARLIEELNVTMISCSPLLLNELNRYAPIGDRLRIVISGGDVLRGDYVSNFIKQAAVYNTYGPTEATVCATYHRLTEEDIIDSHSSVPIGRPIANYRVYILDRNENPLSTGVPGELCIAGEGVARGYLNRPELTDEKFIANPFVPADRMYKSGDLARWLPDGRVEFIRRIDSQVNIRGFRIELGEIESRLVRHEGIKEAAVVDKEDDDGNKTLCAYIVSDVQLSPSAIRAHLAEQLPEYMLPSFIVAMEKLPLNTSGKVDKKALPEPEGLIMREAEYTPPEDDIEEKMADAWSEVLGIEKVSVHDNFFASGGDSIKAIQVAGRLQRHRLKMEVAQLFQHPTIRKLRPYITQVQRKAFQGDVFGSVFLTPVQQWFFNRSSENNVRWHHHWNQAVMLHKADAFDPQILRPVLAALVRRHDALRMTYRDVHNDVGSGTVEQENRGTEPETGKGDDSFFSFNLFNMETDPQPEKAIAHEVEKIQGSLDLSYGPLVAGGLFKTANGDHLLLAIHHLVVDGISWRILLEDFAFAYENMAAGKPVKFQEKTDSYKEWAAQLKNYASGKELLRELEYWKTVESTPSAPLPVDRQASSNLVKNSALQTVRLDRENTGKLLKEAGEAYRTEINDLLLAALGLAVHQWAGLDSFVVNLEGHGREEVIEGLDITRTVGWFTTLYPVVLDMTKSGDIAYTIKNTKETLRRVPNKGFGYGALKYITPIDKKPGMAFELEPEISFNYLGQADQDMGGAGFRMSSIKVGNMHHPESPRDHRFDINGMVVNGCLELDFDYNSEEYDEETVRRLAESYRESLLQVINHCLQQEEVELTPTDLGHEDLTLDELDELQEELDDLLDDDDF